jgi:hypothetical protein
LLALACAALLNTNDAHAATLVQAPGANYLAFEAESATLQVAAPTTWVVTNDSKASGSATLYAAGDSKTDASSSFATYHLKFSSPGTYYLHYRWMADPARAALDVNTANSIRIANVFGDPTSVDNYPVSSSNGKAAPASTNYSINSEATVYTVTAADVAAGAPLVLRVGTREAGFLLDRLILSQEQTITEASFNSAVNAETDLIVQNPGQNFLAFEAETSKAQILAGTPTSWVRTNDSQASARGAIYGAGDSKTDESSSFVTYSLQFRSAGTYYLHYRWKADAARAALDVNTANSIRIANVFGEPTSVDNYPVSASNGRSAPASTNYSISSEATAFTVSAADVGAGTVLKFRVGTREAGFYLDRLVFSQEQTLTEGAFNALPNSGADAAPPTIVRAFGSASFTNLTVEFSKAITPASASVTNFTLSGGIRVLGATIDTNTSKSIILTTTAQSEGSNYVLTVSNVTDANGNTIAAETSTNFTAWKLAVGWVTREFYYDIPGDTVDSLIDFTQKFPHSPDKVDVVQSFQVNNDPQLNAMGVRLTGYFTPATSGTYEFFMASDDEAYLYLSSNASEAGLNLALSSSTSTTMAFDESVKATATLTGGQRYMVRVLLKQNTGDVRLRLGVRREGSGVALSTLPTLSGAQLSTFINPDLSAISITRQPVAVTTTVGGRARFSVEARSEAPNVVYQWQRNGVNIPDATRPTYVTPVLTANDSNAVYRVVISAAGNSVTSSEAGVTLSGTAEGEAQPFIGVNFVGGTTGVPGGTLLSNDVSGVVLQENFNNITATTGENLSLNDAEGRPTPVTLTFQSAGTWYTGSGSTDADRILYQGHIHNNNQPLSLTFNNVPTGQYDVLVYSVGFHFNATYEQAVSAAGGNSNTVFMRAFTGADYIANPNFVRATGTSEANRNSGTYVRLEKITPATDGSIVVTLTPQSTNSGNNYLPPVSAIQLVRSSTAIARPTLTVSRNNNNQVTLSWNDLATGFVLEAASSVTGPWTPVSGVPSPISAGGSITVNSSGNASMQFYRLRRL